MQLTQMSDYALRLLMYAAVHADAPAGPAAATSSSKRTAGRRAGSDVPARRVTIAEVAQAHAVSQAHLMKVTHLLAQAGFLDTQRGKGGGFRLARAAPDIRLGDVVRTVEPHFALVECFSGGSRCALTGHCRLAQVLGCALDAFMQRLDAVSLAALLPSPPSKLHPSTTGAPRSPVKPGRPVRTLALQPIPITRVAPRRPAR
jgi:Rrf2 family nitric oxide-sensitive transcriptional repressor